jgi:S1-C subfamily serine protease
MSPEMMNRIATELSSRRVDPANQTARGFGAVFGSAVQAVPLIVKRDGTGSAVLYQRTLGGGLLVTNYHVVTPPFVDADGTSLVGVLFYDPRFARDVVDADRVLSCLRGLDLTPWCSVLNSAILVGTVHRVDADRDLAVVLTRNVPLGVQPIQAGTLAQVNPGDEVAVIGHPLGFLWSLTTGIISGMRIGAISSSPAAPTVTVVQTQTPINPGNSGGPLLSSTGRLLGIMFATKTVPVRMQAGSPPVDLSSQGINLAIGVNEVSDFVTRAITK